MNDSILARNNALRAVWRKRETSLALILAIMCVALSFATTSFFTSDNLFNILKQTTLVRIIAIGQTFVIISGGIDLSVGQSMTLGSLILAYSLEAGIPLVISILLGILASMLVGTCNGLLITKLRLPAFIITLGMTNIVKGAILVMSEGNIVLLDDPVIAAIGRDSLGPVPWMVIILAVLAVICIFILNKTAFGNHVESVGGNEMAARLSGISVDKTRMLVYTIAGLLCGIAAIIVTGRLNGGNPNAAGTYDMDSIAAVIVGGTALNGGSGSIFGTILGALIMILIRNGLVLLRVNIYWQTVAIGVVIIAVCAIDAFSNARKQK